MSEFLSEYFRHPGYVAWGMLAALAPLLIYLIYRWKLRRVHWGAMTFLLRARARVKTRLQFQHILMLLLRTLIVVLIVCGLARPLLKRGALFGQRSGLAVIVLDVSYSMGLRGEAGAALIDTAKESALAIVEALGEGDRVAVLAMGSDTDVVLPPDLDRNKAAAEIRRIELTDGSTDLTKGIEEAAKVLERSDASIRMAYIITDFQGNAWKPSRTEARLGDAIRALGKAGKVALIDVNERAGGTPGAAVPASIENCAVTALRAGDDLIAEGMPAVFSAEIMNYSSRPHDVTLHWEVEDVHREHPLELTLPVQPEPLKVEWKHVFPKAGNYRVKLRIQEKSRAAGIPADDERYLAVNVRRAIDVLVVQGGDPNLDLFEREADFLVLALVPEEGAAGSRYSVASRKVIPGPDIAAARFNEYDVVIMANVRLVPEDVARRLEDFVREGGGLLVFLGDDVDTGAYNLGLYRDGKGVLPAELLSGLGPDRDAGRLEGGKASVGLDPLEHPMTVSMRTGDYGQPAEVLIRTYMKVRAVAGDARIICRYSDGAPAILEKRFGRGNAVLVTTACDRDWGDMPVQPLYLPLVQDSIRYLLRKQRLDILVGEEWSKVLLSSERGHPIVITAPGSVRHEMLSEAKDEDTAMLVYRETGRKGFYHVGIEGVGEMLFAANVDTEEGLPDRVSDAEVRRLFPKFEHEYFDTTRDIKKAARELMAGSELTKAFLYAALALLCLEVCLGYAFRSGVGRGRAE